MENKELKSAMIVDCPLCNGAGKMKVPIPPNYKEQAVLAMVEYNIAYRRIADLLGYKSTNSITNILKKYGRIKKL